MIPGPVIPAWVCTLSPGIVRALLRVGEWCCCLVVCGSAVWVCLAAVSASQSSLRCWRIGSSQAAPGALSDDDASPVPGLAGTFRPQIRLRSFVALKVPHMTHP